MAGLQSFLCPISCEIMRDPVIARDGHSYERAQITRWFQSHRRSPVTNEELPSTELMPNYSLKQAILEHEAATAPCRTTIATQQPSAPPLDAPRRRSPTSQQPTRITFVCRLRSPVDILWVDEDGVDVPYSHVAPDMLYTQDTYAGHVWKITHAGALLDYYEAPSWPSVVEILDVRSLRVSSDTTVPTPIVVEFLNATAVAIALVWQTSNDTDVPYMTLAPGQSYEQITYAHHMWKALDVRSNALLVRLCTTTQSEHVTIRGTRSLVRRPI
ncbi:hypothetical protein SPRG_07470 [Saprolegnia parasitica CBS 223.65]|uniref:U-box domain-containing protein n=1 Tax=Saprolegnia parasitica (strain CBS 223.65) TaxID=695850 RepID=A0A067CL07_SAPPC|nr:hypothetical protein SPRG_07470 [Saprolegnia parasitica CBS 223.65]KDO27221.1 hypothetical protein SPRG_07470 [Saprolegnia parasitica CBS 223.65]|eukprot:XP_012201999.1 hypothetical protein SPRG_07470 [Saprolegnia parasitica CBS 223.65]